MPITNENKDNINTYLRVKDPREPVDPRIAKAILKNQFLFNNVHIARKSSPSKSRRVQPGRKVVPYPRPCNE